MTAVTKSAFLYLLMFFTISAWAQEYDASEMPTVEELQAALQLLRDDPAAPEAKDAADKIMVFGHLSDDVFVSLKARYTPWMLGNIPEIVEDKLVAAFVGGNIEHQLLIGKTIDSPYQGTLLQLIVYAKLREAGMCPPVRRLDLYLQWQKEGSLGARFN